MDLIWVQQFRRLTQQYVELQIEIHEKIFENEKQSSKKEY